MILHHPLLRRAVLALLFVAGAAAAAPNPALPAYQPANRVDGAIASIGDDKMQTLMDVWLLQLRRRQPGLRPGPRWEHQGEASAIGALMFETADMAPLTRLPLPSETAPYAH